MTELREAIEKWIVANGKSNNIKAGNMYWGYRHGAETMLDLLWPCVEALKCNKTFHSLGGIDDCEPCLALKSLKEKVGK